MQNDRNVIDSLIIKSLHREVVRLMSIEALFLYASEERDLHTIFVSPMTFVILSSVLGD